MKYTHDNDYAIAIDLGGTFIKYALVNHKGRIVSDGKITSCANESSEKVICRINEAVMNCKGFAIQHSYNLIGIGIGTPGIVDETCRIVLGGAENIAGWCNVPLAEMMEEKHQLPSFVNNDANMMGLGEICYGVAKDCGNVVFITIGTGIGGVAMIDGKLFGGYANRGMEIGHIPLIANGCRCACGSVGCLEAYASATALIKRFKTICHNSNMYSDGEVDGKLIVELYHQHHPAAQKAMDEHVDYLGHGIAGLVNIFSPQAVIIGGGLSESGSFYIDMIYQRMLRYVLPESAVNTSLYAASLGNKAGLMGAARFVFDNYKPSI